MLSSKRQKRFSFLFFLKDLFLNPKTFSTKYLNKNQKPYFKKLFIINVLNYTVLIFPVIVIGIYNFKFITTAIIFLINILKAIAITYLIQYIILGWFCKIRVKWSGGEINTQMSRNLSFYSSISHIIPMFCLNIIFSIFGVFFILKTEINSEENLLYLLDYIVKNLLVFISFPLIYSLLSFFSITYSSIVFYKMVSNFTNIHNKRLKFWFLILPILTSSFIMFLFILLIILSMLGR